MSEPAPTIAPELATHIESGVAEGSPTRDNLRANGAIALTFSSPTTYRTVQAKGVVTELREPSEGDLARRGEHLEDLCDQAEQVGIERRLTRRLARGEAVAVAVAVRELYEQTPGPGAGTRL